MEAPFIYRPTSVKGNGQDALLKAALDGDLGRIKGIVRGLGYGSSDRAAVFSTNKFGYGVMHCAACAGHLEVCKYLVEELGGDPNMTAAEGISLTLPRSGYRSYMVVTLVLGILKRVKYDSALFFAGMTPLMAAAQSGDLSTVKYFLDHGGDLTKTDEKGRMALHHAACSGSCMVTEFLLSKGIPVDIDCGHGTPLYQAVVNEQDKTTKILLDRHANPNTNFSGTTPLNAAVIYRSLKCMKLLIKAGADVDGKGSLLSPLLFATEQGGYTDYVRLLLKAGANPNIPDDLGRLPIELAAINDCREEVEMLFPLTSPIPTVPNWSINGVISHAKMKNCKASG